MRKITILLLVILLALSTGLSLALDQSPYLTTTLTKTYHTIQDYPRREVEVMVTILTRTDIEPSDTKGSIIYAFKFHDMLCDAFLRKGWSVTHPLAKKLDAGTIELTFEPRLKRVVMKTFIYPCDKDPLWNMMKYRGGSHEKYFDKVAEKTETCIRDKYHLRN